MNSISCLCRPCNDYLKQSGTVSLQQPLLIQEYSKHQSIQQTMMNQLKTNGSAFSIATIHQLRIPDDFNVGCTVLSKFEVYASLKRE
jgi:hypothetical protein